MKHYIYGDLHNGDYGELLPLSKNNFPIQKKLTKDNILFQLGDFGCYLHYPTTEDYKKELRNRKDLSSRNFTLFVILGNHENFDLIYDLPLVEKWGGLVYEEKLEGGSIYIAKHGEVYTINGKTIFVYGGARSSDIEYRHSFDEIGKYKSVKKYRYGEYIGRRRKKIKLSQVTYWKEEIPSSLDQLNALYNLAKHNYKVDYVMTHTCPQSIIPQVFENTVDNFDNKFSCPVAYFLDKVYLKINFSKWFFAHFHLNKEFKSEKGIFYSHFKSKPLEEEF